MKVLIVNDEFEIRINWIQRLNRQKIEVLPIPKDTDAASKHTPDELINEIQNVVLNEGDVAILDVFLGKWDSKFEGEAGFNGFDMFKALAQKPQHKKDNKLIFTTYFATYYGEGECRKKIRSKCCPELTEEKISDWERDGTIVYMLDEIEPILRLIKPFNLWDAYNTLLNPFFYTLYIPIDHILHSEGEVNSQLFAPDDTEGDFCAESLGEALERAKNYFNDYVLSSVRENPHFEDERDTIGKMLYNMVNTLYSALITETEPMKRLKKIESLVRDGECANFLEEFNEATSALKSILGEAWKE